MKIIYLLLILAIVLVEGQRRTVKSESSDIDPKPSRRGRARFAPEQLPEEPKQEPSRRRVTGRGRSEVEKPSPVESSTTNRRNYEVEEQIDENPVETLRRPGKTRVLTESKFEAKNAPSPNVLFQPSTTENFDEVIQSIGSDLLEPASSSAPSSTTPIAVSSEETILQTSAAPRHDNEIRRETSRRQTEAPVTASSRRRSNLRTRAPVKSVKSEEPTTSRSRTRSRVSAKAAEEPTSPTPIPSRNVVRGSRRRVESVSTERAQRTRGPSVVASAEPVELQSRARPGRRIPTVNRKEEAPEKITIDLPKSRSRGRIPEASTTERARTRSRTRLIPPIIDEQKLEVLPLFEAEAKTVLPPRNNLLSRRENVQTSATEKQIKIVPNVKESVIVETRTESSFTRRKVSKPLIRQSVVSEVTEVTSKRTITRKPLRLLKPTRVNKKESKSKSSLTSSEEEIDDMDNYPAAFKALLQAKKDNKESRPSSATVTKTPERSVISSSTIASSEAPQQIEDADNELEPKSIVRPTRKRFSQLPTRATPKALPTRKSKVVRSTISPPLSTTKEYKVHAKFTDSTIKSKPTRGLYSSRKSKEGIARSTTNQISSPSIPKKTNRFSARYRTDASSRSTLRTSTNAPAYLPTIPTLNPPTTVKFPIALEDRDLGVEVITFDDPVNTVASANLVNGEYIASTTDSNHLTIPLVSRAQTKTTEKPVSIIERIINSITAISTTEIPNSSTLLTTPVAESLTKGSAILKLATKKPTKLDKTDKTTEIVEVVSVTSERPTTIIERIISSLSAIQGDNSSLKKQVGTTFNTLSSPSTTPMSKVAKSTLPAQISTSVNPLSVLDEISNEQTLQKRTIGKLLSLLNGLTSTTASPDAQFVVVTPKSNTITTSTIPPTTTTTIPETTQLFTSPRPLTSSESTMRFTSTPTTTNTPETTTASSSSSTLPNDLVNDLGVLPLFVAPSVTNLGITTESGISTTLPSIEGFDTETTYFFPSTIPALVNFEVSPGSVSIFSANDLSNTITPDDLSTSTITIAGRTGTSESTTESSTTTDSVDTNATTETVLNSTIESRFADSETSTSTTVEPDSTTIVSTMSIAETSTVESTTLSANINQTTVGNSSSPTNSNRSGRLLNVVQEPVQNSLETSTSPDKDYFIFAVLNNNTILRKRPSRFPNKETPFLIVGVYPNSTIVRKFPNGTLVPMEPIVRVDQNTIGSTQPESTTTESTISNTISSIEANPLSISSSVNSTESSTVSTTTTLPISTTTTSSPSTLPTLTEILNGKTVQAFNSIINISDLTKTQTLDVDPKNNVTTTTLRTTPTLSNGILETSPPPTTTPVTDSTTVSTTTAPTTFRTTTGFPSTTFLPTFLTTLLSTIQPRKFITTTLPPTTLPPTTQPPPTTTTPPPTTTRTTLPPITTPAPTTTTPSPTTTPTPTTTTPSPTTTPVATTKAPSTTTPTPTTTQPPVQVTVTAQEEVSTIRTVRTTAIPSTLPPVSTTIRVVRTTGSSESATTTEPSSKTKVLTDQQKKDLQAIAQLENEQATLLKQLSFLAKFANVNPSSATTTTTERSELANRIIALAVERDNAKTTTTTSAPTTIGSRQAKKIEGNQGENSLEDLVQQINLATPSTLSSSYGKSNDALIAALLKEQGIGPTTPKALGDIYTLTTTTKRPKPTTPRPGPLMQSLSWLLNVLAPPTTKRPKSQKAPKRPDPEELLTHQPTHITPVITAAPPRQSVADSLSQTDIRKLIKQLETIQKNPSSGQKLDVTSIKGLESLLSPEVQGVQVSSRGVANEIQPIVTNRGRVTKSTSVAPVSVSNSVEEEELVVSTEKPKKTLPPLRLNPVPGIEQDGTMVRGQLITAAVNVTRAISSFLGTALQDAAQQFTRLFSGGSGNLTQLLGSSIVVNNTRN